jgi:hypothetical protein
VNALLIGQDGVDVFVSDVFVHEFALAVARKALVGFRDIEPMFRVAADTAGCNVVTGMGACIDVRSCSFMTRPAVGFARVCPRDRVDVVMASRARKVVDMPAPGVGSGCVIVAGSTVHWLDHLDVRFLEGVEAHVTVHAVQPTVRRVFIGRWIDVQRDFPSVAFHRERLIVVTIEAFLDVSRPRAFIRERPTDLG